MRAAAARVLGFALIGGFLLTGLAASRPSASAVAGSEDPECATAPQECVTVTITNSGDGAGATKVISPSGIFVLCSYESGASSGACSITSHVGPTGGLMRVVVIADEGSVGCFPTCAVGLVAYERTVQPGVWSVDVAFEDLLLAVEVSLDGPGSGRVVSVPAGIDCPDTCSMEATFGDTVHLTATPDTGMVFEGWSGGGCSGQDTTCDYLVEYAAMTITATFVRNPPISQPPPSPSASVLPTPSPRPSASARATAGPSAGPSASAEPSIDLSSSPLASESAGPSAAPASAALPTPLATLAPTAPTGDSRDGVGSLVILLVIALALGGGGAWWWRRRSAATP